MEVKMAATTRILKKLSLGHLTELFHTDNNTPDMLSKLKPVLYPPDETEIRDTDKPDKINIYNLGQIALENAKNMKL